MTFAKSLSISVELGDEVNEVARGVAFSIYRLIALATPVGKPSLWVYKHPTRGYIDYLGWFGAPPDGYTGGTARGNWFVGVNKPVRKISPTRRKKDSDIEAKTAIEEAKSFEYPTIVISNNLPYIERLNDGHSSQAPAKFVELAIQKVKNG